MNKNALKTQIKVRDCYPNGPHIRDIYPMDSEVNILFYTKIMGKEYFAVPNPKYPKLPESDCFYHLSTTILDDFYIFTRIAGKILEVQVRNSLFEQILTESAGQLIGKQEVAIKKKKSIH